VNTAALQTTRSVPTVPRSSVAPPTPRSRILSDIELITLAARGEHPALEELYGRHSRLLLGLALRLLRNRQDAEEVLQEVFLYLWNKAGDYDPRKASVTSWLVLITRSRSLDRIRRRQRHGQMQEELQLEEAPPKSTAEGYGQVLSRERSARLRRAIERLPTAQRQVLQYSYYRGWTQREVAKEMGVPIGTVKTRTFLAMKKLRRELRGELGQLMSLNARRFSRRR
jgi:RNA polymerase sigma-70 factor (ECF subfamily)